VHKILVTGHTGFVGKSLVEYVKHKQIQVMGFSKSNGFDLTRLHDLGFLDPENISGIIHLAADSDVNACEKNRKVPFVFASSDQVFDGLKGNYCPEDETCPINEYGKQKLLAENEIQKVNSQAVICRLALMIGEHGGYEKAFVENVKAGKEQTLFTDEIRSVLPVEDAAKFLFKALHLQAGIYHVGGLKAMNRYELGLQLATKHNLKSSLLKQGLQKDVVLLAQRPKNVSFKIEK
jgi:dTDP-4-dehydrorhamnose reductase